MPEIEKTNPFKPNETSVLSAEGASGFPSRIQRNDETKLNDPREGSSFSLAPTFRKASPPHPILARIT